MATRPGTHLTYDDYVNLPDGQRWELIDGEAWMIASPNRRHQQVIGDIYLQVANHVKAHGGGEVFVAPFDVVLDPDRHVFQPDIVFVADADMDVLTDANIWGSPTWAVEVLSPTRPERDRLVKLPRYARFGVRELWIVDPEEDAVEMYRLADGAYAPAIGVRPPDAARPLLPHGLAIDLTEVFRR